MMLIGRGMSDRDEGNAVERLAVEAEERWERVIQDWEQALKRLPA
jgi:hypothetical protein